METRSVHKNFHNITASGNAVLHLGDFINVRSEGSQEEAIILKEIVERLDFITHCIAGSRQDDSLARNGSRITPATGLAEGSSGAGAEPFPRSRSPRARPVGYASPCTTSARTLQARDYHGIIPTASRENTPALRRRDHCKARVIVKEFLIGVLVLRRQRSHSAAERTNRPPENERWHLSARFVPKPWFSQRAVQLNLKWCVSQKRCSRMTFSPSFADVVPDNHPMILCAATGDIDGLRALLSLRDRPSPSCVTPANWTPLHFAAAAGHDGICTILLQSGSDPNFAGDSNISPLHTAAHFGRLETFRLLLNAGGDLDDVNDHGLNPVFEFLASHASFESADFHTFMHWLLMGQDRYFIDMGMSDNEGHSLPHSLLAAHSSNPEYSIDKSHSLGLRKFDFDAVVPLIPDLNAKDVYGSSLLHSACELGNFDMVRALVQRGCDIDSRDRHNYTPLHLAVVNGHCELVEILLENGADPKVTAVPMNVTPSHYYSPIRITPLSLVAVNSNMQIWERLWNSAIYDDQDLVRSVYWDTPLAIAMDHENLDSANCFATAVKDKALLSRAIAMSFNPGIIESLVQAGASPDGQTNILNAINEEHILMPLLWAAKHNALDAAQKLLDLGADVNLVDSGGKSALHYAAKYGFDRLVNLLLSWNAEFQDRDMCDHDPAQMTSLNGYEDLVSELDTVAEMPMPIVREGTPSKNKLSLQSACRSDELELAMRLVAEGASLDSIPEIASTPLILSLRWRSFRVAEFLINAGASVHPSYHRMGLSSDKIRVVPLLYAAARCKPRLIRLMFNRGANVNEVSEDDETPLLHALDSFWSDGTMEMRAETVNTLLELGAKINVRDAYGRTPLGNAVQIGALAATCSLIHGGATLDTICTTNLSTPIHGIDCVMTVAPRTPIAWAAYYGHEDVVKLLYQAGAQWKNLKKDPTMNYIHPGLMKLWFIDPFIIVKPEAEQKISPHDRAGGFRTNETDTSNDLEETIEITADKQEWHVDRNETRKVTRLPFMTKVRSMQLIGILYQALLRFMSEILVFIIVSMLLVFWRFCSGLLRLIVKLL